jgi:hypothetical protein
MDVTRVVPRAGFVVAVAMVLALATASAASAQSSEVDKDGTEHRIVYTDPASNTDDIYLGWEMGGDQDEHVIGVNGGDNPIDGGSGCGGGPPVFFCGTDMLSLAATLGGDNDVLDLRPASTEGHPLPSAIAGGSGDDIVYGGAAVDDVGGGTGNDKLVGLTAGDEFRGQDGTDTLDVTAPAAGFTITLDDVPDDGTGAGGSANIGSDVEVLLGGTGSDDFSGGVGAETLDGGGGDDILEGGAGADQLRGGPGADTILAQDRAVDVIGCGDGTDAVFADWNDTVAPGCETVTRAARDDDGDGSPSGVDCNDANPAVKPGGGDIPGNGLDEDCAGGDAVVDADGDGAGVAVDCDDRNAARFPGATEIPANGVDDDCDGRDGAFPEVAATVSSGWKVFARYTKLTSLKVKGAPAGAKVRVSCKGGKKKGCPFKKKTSTVDAKGKASLTKRFKGRKLKPGAVIEVRISAPSAIAKVLRIRIRDDKAPKRVTLCLPPGADKPSDCG